MSTHNYVHEAVAGAGNSRAMETRDHFKNGVSLKNQMSRGNFLISFLAFLCFCLALSIDNIYAQGGIAKTAKPLILGEKYDFKISPPIKTEQGNEYYRFVADAPVFSDFKIVIPEDGSLTLTIESFAEHIALALYNENGKSLNPVKDDIITGDKGSCGLGNPEAFLAFDSENTLCFRWNPTVEKFFGNLTFKLDAGTYYLRICRGQQGLSKANISLKLIDLDGNEINQ